MFQFASALDLIFFTVYHSNQEVVQSLIGRDWTLFCFSVVISLLQSSQHQLKEQKLGDDFSNSAVLLFFAVNINLQVEVG